MKATQECYTKNLLITSGHLPSSSEEASEDKDDRIFETSSLPGRQELNRPSQQEKCSLEKPKKQHNKTKNKNKWLVSITQICSICAKYATTRTFHPSFNKVNFNFYQQFFF